MAACEIRSVIAGSAGSHIKGFNSHGVVAVRNREVAAGDVERVVDAARAVALPTDQEVLHVLPQEFIVDDQDGIREPVGMAGVRLEARVHIVTGAVSAGQNLIKCCNRAGLHVRDVLAGPLAAAEAVLTPEERDPRLVSRIPLRPAVACSPATLPKPTTDPTADGYAFDHFDPAIVPTVDGLACAPWRNVPPTML